MTLEKKDFIEIEFTGRVKDGEVFDSNIKDDLEKAELKTEPKPFAFCLGEGMFLNGVEDFLIGKKIGEYEIELSPEKAFGKRNPSLVQLIPMKVFAQQKVRPVPGAMFNFDGRIAKILSVSGGRVMADFNHPLAGKEVLYKIKVLRKIEEQDEKIKSFINFLFKKEIPFEVKDKKIILEAEQQFSQFVNLFKDKFKDLFGMEIGIKEISPKIEKKSQ